MKTTMKIMLLAVVLVIGTRVVGQDRLYKEGSIWNVQFVRTNAGLGVDQKAIC